MCVYEYGRQLDLYLGIDSYENILQRSLTIVDPLAGELTWNDPAPHRFKSPSTLYEPSQRRLGYRYSYDLLGLGASIPGWTLSSGDTRLLWTACIRTSSMLLSPSNLEGQTRNWNIGFPSPRSERHPDTSQYLVRVFMST